MPDEQKTTPDYWARFVGSLVAVLISLVVTAQGCYQETRGVETPQSIYVQDSTGVVVDAPKIAALADEKPDSYTITQWATGQQPKRIAVVIGDGVAPKPDPKPDPKPEPQPKPTPAELWCVIVEESADRTPQQAAVMLSQKFRALFAPSKFLLVDKDHGDSSTAVYIQRAVGSKLPRIFIVTPAGDVVFDGDLPNTEADAIALVNRIKGGK